MRISDFGMKTGVFHNPQSEIRIPQSSGFFQSRVFFDEFLLAEAGKADGEFGGVAAAFAAEDEAAPVLGMADVCAGYEAVARRRGSG